VKLLVVILLFLLVISLACPQGTKPPVLPAVPGTRSIREPGELPTLKLISGDGQSVLCVKQTKAGFNLTLLKFSPPVPKMK
jgi:hypothetical protein